MRVCVCAFVCVCASVCVCRIGAHTVHPIAMKVSQVVVNMLAVVSEVKKWVLPYIPILLKFCTNVNEILHNFETRGKLLS